MPVHHQNEDSEPAGFERSVRRYFLPAGVHPADAEGRARIGAIEGAVGVVLSIALAGAKAVLAWVSGSISLWADAANNVADIGSSVVVILGFRWARKPRDREHPFGHGRAESLTTLVLALILVGVGIEVARAGFGRIVSPTPVEAPAWVLAAVGLTIVLKGLMTLWVRGLVALTRSTVLETDLWNHAFDMVSTSLVFLALLGANRGWSRLDGWAALGVAFVIAWTGLRYVRTAATSLLGTAPSEAELARIRRGASRVPGVRGAHDILIHRYGDTRVISLHIEVDARLSVLNAHALAERVESDLAAREDARITAHVDPVDRSHVLYDEVDAALRAITQAQPELVGYHDLRLAGTPPRYSLTVDLVVHAGIPASEFAAILESARRLLHDRVPGVGEIDVGVETEYASEHEQRQVFRRKGTGDARD